MQLTPRYDGEPVLRMASLVDDPATPLLRQRARLASALADLDDAQWAAPSRCEGWSVQDVISHLVSTNQFWSLSINAGLQGAPTQFLATFDPVATPAQLVEAVRTWTPAQTLAKFTESNDVLAASIRAVGDSWETVAEAPPGHIALRLVALHALWDSWIHERDVLLPLGREVAEEDDEIAASLAYAAGLGPAVLAAGGSTRVGALEVVASDPDVRVLVELGPTVDLHDGPSPSGTVTIAGDAVDLVEALSFRVPFPATLADDDRWLLGSLAEVFDLTP